MRKYLKSLSIKFKLLIFSLCIALLPLVVITSINHLNARSTLTQQTLNWLTTTAESRRHLILSLLEAKKGLTIEASTDEHIEESLETIIYGEHFTRDAVDTLNSHIMEEMEVFKDILETNILDVYGTVVTSSNKTLVGKNIPDQKEVIAQALGKKRAEACLCQPRFIPRLNAYCLLISSPIFSKNTHKVIGVFVNTYDVDILNLITANRLWMWETDETYLVNREGLMLTKSRFVDNAPLKQAVDTEPINKIAESGEDMKGIYLGYRGTPVVGVSLYMPEYSWTLLTEIDTAEAFASLRMRSITATVVGLIAAVVVAGMVVIFAISTAGPINKLKVATEKFMAGDLGYRVRVSGGDEIGGLAHSFNAMADKLGETIAKQKQAEEALKCAAEEKDENIKDLRGLIEFSILVREETREKDLINHATHVLKERFSMDVIAVLMLDKQRNVLAMSNICPPMSAEKLLAPEVFLDPSLCYALRTGKKFVVKDIHKDLPCHWLQYKVDEGGYVCTPLVAGGNTIGTVLMIKKKDFWEDRKLELMSAYIGLMAAAIRSVRFMAATRRTAITDALTGIYNRRFFDEVLDKQMALASRRNEPLSTLLVDLDHFKDFNDTYGHMTGDRVLQQVASVLKASLRLSDVLTRYGGEEFAIIMPMTDIADAIKKANKIRLCVESEDFANIVTGKTFKITISIGVATFPEHGGKPETLMNTADRALYKAKRGGRNRAETP